MLRPRPPAEAQGSANLGGWAVPAGPAVHRPLPRAAHEVPIPFFFADDHANGCKEIEETFLTQRYLPGGQNKRALCPLSSHAPAYGWKTVKPILRDQESLAVRFFQILDSPGDWLSVTGEGGRSEGRPRSGGAGWEPHGRLGERAPPGKLGPVKSGRTWPQTAPSRTQRVTTSRGRDPASAARLARAPPPFSET